MRGSIQQFMDDALSRIQTWEKLSEDYPCAKYTRILNNYRTAYRVEKRFHDGIKSFIDESHHVDEQINKFVDECVREYHLSGYGFPTAWCESNNIDIRPEVIRMCVYMIEHVFKLAPTPRKIHPAPRVVTGKHSHSYALKHVLEDWLDYFYGSVEPSYSYVSNGEGCVVAMYFNKYGPNVMRIGKIPPRYGREPNIDLSYSNILREFMTREPYIIKNK